MENKMLTVFKTGLDGDATYSLKADDGKIIHSKMALKNLAETIVKKYPTLAEKIANFYKTLFDDFSDEFDLSRVDPSKREDFIKNVSEMVENNKTNDISLKVKERIEVRR